VYIYVVLHVHLCGFTRTSMWFYGDHIKSCIRMVFNASSQVGRPRKVVGGWNNVKMHLCLQYDVYQMLKGQSISIVLFICKATKFCGWHNCDVNSSYPVIESKWQWMMVLAAKMARKWWTCHCINYCTAPSSLAKQCASFICCSSTSILPKI